MLTLVKATDQVEAVSEETTQEAEMQVVWEELAVEEVEQVLTKWLVNKI
jgi:hypothetical protein